MTTHFSYDADREGFVYRRNQPSYYFTVDASCSPPVCLLKFYKKTVLGAGLDNLREDPFVYETPLCQAFVQKIRSGETEELLEWIRSLEERIYRRMENA